MLAYQALALTGSPVFVGLQASVFALAGLLVALPAGRLADRFGSSLVATGGLLVCLLGVATVLALPTIAGMLLAAFLVGLGHICTLVGQQSLVTRLAVGASNDSAFGTLTAASSVGQLIGPLVVTTIAMLGGSGSAIPNTWAGLAASGALLLLALPPFFTLHRAEVRAGPPPASAAARVSIGSVVRVPGMWRSLLVSGTVIVSVDLLASFLPVWAVSRDIAPSAVGLLLALRALFTISSRFGMSRLVARFGRKRLLIVSLSLAIIALVLLPLAGVWLAIPIMCLIGLGLGLPQPLTLAWVAALAPPTARGAALGTRMTLNRLAQVSIPLAVGVVAGPVGVAAVFWIAAGILVGSLAVITATEARTSRGHGG